ncbi:MAG: Ig-like domain-containing protein, partial [Anaerolineaceae bacterium]
SPLPDQFVTEGVPLNVEVEATSAGGLARVELFGQGFPESPDPGLSFPPIPSRTTATLTTALPALPIGSGELYVRLHARVTGVLGSQSLVSLRLPVRTTVGGVAPVVNLTPADGAVCYEGNVCALHATATDDGGVQAVRLFLNGNQVAETTIGGDVAFEFVPVAVGQALVRAEAEDAAGQVTVVERAIAIFLDPPPVIDIELKASAIQGIEQTYRATVTDNGTVASVVFRFNGEAVIPVRNGLFYEASYTLLSAATEILFEVEATDSRGFVSLASLVVGVDAGNGRYTPDEVNLGRVTQPRPAYSIATNLDAPSWLTADPFSQDIYFVEAASHRVRKLQSGLIRDVAGTGVQGFSGDGGSATLATFSDIGGIALNDAGDLYISDAGNNRIRRVGFDGVVATVAGNGAVGDAGPAVGRDPLSVGLNQPTSVAVAPDGLGGDVVYIADTQGHRIWELRGGVMSVLAGSTAAGDYAGESADLATAHIGEPVGLHLQGSALIASDRLNGAVFSIDLTQRRLRTLLGTGTPGYSGDDGPARAAQVDGPAAALISPTNGEAVVADSRNNRVRMVTPDGRVVTVAGTGGAPPSVDSTPLSLPLAPFGLTLLPNRGYYGGPMTVVTSEPSLNSISAFQLGVVAGDMSIGGPPDREILGLDFESPVNWVSLKNLGTPRDFSVIAYPGLVNWGDYEVPLTVHIRVRDLSQCDVLGVCAESTVTETVVVRIRIFPEL